MSGRRGEAGGHGNGERQRRWRSGVRGREQGERRRARESARGVGVAAWRLRGIQTRRGEGRQAGRLVAWRGGARARRARAHPPVEDEDDRGGGQWAGPALAAVGLRREEAQVSLPFYFCFLFYFSDICFDLKKILNHLFNLCQFLQELYILFQSSFINGIIFGHILIYITNIFPMQIFMH